MSLSRPKLISVVGARPQFVKLAPVARALDAAQAEHRVIHTGQHYDTAMSGDFFELLELPQPDLNLEIGSGSHGAQTGAMLNKLEAAFVSEQPDAVYVYGDTNSTLAATLAAAKLHIPVLHIEAGLRSYNRHMPEEINRIVADHCGDRLYAPTPNAVKILNDEGLGSVTVHSGDVMRDAVNFHIQRARDESDVLAKLGLTTHDFALMTLHRAENTTAERLAALLPLLERLAAERTIIFPIHPRTRSVIAQLPGLSLQNLRIVDPLDYLDMLRAVEAARFVLSDSGGLQKEAAYLGTACMTLREQTEWVELIQIGVNRLTGLDAEQIEATFRTLDDSNAEFDAQTSRAIDELYGAGDAAEHITQDSLDWLAKRESGSTPKE